MPAPKRSERPRRIRIAKPAPVLDNGRYAVKRTVGDTVAVSADIFRDGHEKMKAVVKYKAPGGRRWLETEMHAVDAHVSGVRWAGEFSVETPGTWQWTVEAWTDRWATWHDELRRKVAADLDEDLTSELSEGVIFLKRALEKAKGDAKGSIEWAIGALESDADINHKFDVALGPELFQAMEETQEREGACALEKPITVEVDRVRARFSAWYELFPRSWGGIKAVEELVPEVADLGFDVLYLLPFHPIGVNKRKGRNNSLTAGPDDPGSPYAIGGAEGGHFAVHPELGTEQDVRDLCATAHKHGMDVALDIALNASADHPWLTEHPEWFQQRPDGTLKYAENPPKRYQDIYNFNWDTDDWQSLWNAWRDVFLHWVDCGIKCYRVDNPHTKPFAFWEWIIKEVHKVDRDVVFLSEAFTRRAVMRELAKLGFTQSYTYFTWKNSRHEMVEYFNELAWSEEKEYFRPNYFPVTPDILHAYLQHGGPAGVRHPPGPRRHAQPELRHLLRLRALRERPGQGGLGGVPELREVRDQGPQARRPAAADDAAPERHPARERRPAVPEQRGLAGRAERPDLRLRQAGAREHDHHGHEPGPAQPAGRPGHDPRRARPRAGVRGRGPVHGQPLRLADRAELRRAQPAHRRQAVPRPEGALS